MTAVEEYRQKLAGFEHTTMAWSHYKRSVSEGKGGNPPTQTKDAARKAVDEAVVKLMVECVRIGNGYKQGRFVDEGMSTPNAVARQLLEEKP